jgi:hypothetical protein
VRFFFSLPSLSTWSCTILRIHTSDDMTTMGNLHCQGRGRGGANWMVAGKKKTRIQCKISVLICTSGCH